MVKIILFMYICSTTPGNECRLIPTAPYEFEDIYSCTVYGYQYSEEIVAGLNKDFVNKYGAHTKFLCKPQFII